MVNKPKTRRVLLLAFLGIALLLIIMTRGLYSMVQVGYGSTAAFLTLMIFTIVILGLICKGVQYAVAIDKAMHNQITTSINQHQTTGITGPSRIKILGQALFQFSEHEQHIETPRGGVIHETNAEIPESNRQTHRHRGKHSRFPIGKITKAVLTWERRDPQFASLTLTEFLEQEFGASPDGILLMAPTTFYDWRRRVLRDLEKKDKEQSKDEGA